MSVSDFFGKFFYVQSGVGKWAIFGPKIFGLKTCSLDFSKVIPDDRHRKLVLHYYHFRFLRKIFYCTQNDLNGQLLGAKLTFLKFQYLFIRFF